MAHLKTLIEAKRIERDGTSYRVQARIDPDALARLLGELTPKAAQEGPLSVAEGAIVISAEPLGQAIRREMEARLPDPEDAGVFPL